MDDNVRKEKNSTIRENGKATRLRHSSMRPVVVEMKLDIKCLNKIEKETSGLYQPGKLPQRRRRHIMKISRERLEEIKNFPETFTDPECPPLTDEQLKQLRPCHLVNRDIWKPKKEVLNIRIDADVLASIKHSGAGWQTRVNDYLRKGVASGQL